MKIVVNRQTDIDVIDSDGFRRNVGIIISNAAGELLWARRVGRPMWQFPQGGIKQNETPQQAMYRELYEETGLAAEQVCVIGATKGWLRYRLPSALVRHNRKPLCIGQKQVWFMLRMLGSDRDIKLDVTDMPEFESWKWVHYWYPLKEVVSFKRSVYKQALRELAPLLEAF